MASTIGKLIDAFATTAIADKPLVSITRSLIGSYCWGSKGNVYIPGYPSTLKKNFMELRVGTLDDRKAPPELGHSNEYLHSVYFEPVQEIVAMSGRKLEDYTLITDRNNLRKLDSALQNDPNYSKFLMYMQKVNGTLVVKREDVAGSGATMVGHEFEKAICEPSEFESCHIVVECNITVGNEKPMKVLIRGETDACAPGNKKLSPKDYKLARTTSSGLQVHTSDARLPLLEDLREIKMSRDLKETHHFQSWLLGIPAIVHGAGRRSESATVEFEDFPERFAKVLQEFQKYSDQMKESKLYKLQWKIGEQQKLVKCRKGDKVLLNLENNDEDSS